MVPKSHTINKHYSFIKVHNRSVQNENEYNNLDNYTKGRQLQNLPKKKKKKKRYCIIGDNPVHN